MHNWVMLEESIPFMVVALTTSVFRINQVFDGGCILNKLRVFKAVSVSKVLQIAMMIGVAVSCKKIKF